ACRAQRPGAFDARMSRADDGRMHVAQARKIFHTAQAPNFRDTLARPATCFQRASSTRFNSAKASADEDLGSKPAALKVSRDEARAMPSCWAALRAWTTAGGMPAGPYRPSQLVTSRSATPCSAMVGTSGNCLLR